jgi:hypothetical protein
MCVNFAILPTMKEQTAMEASLLKPLTFDTLPLPFLGGAALWHLLGGRKVEARQTAETSLRQARKQQILEFELVADASDDLYDGLGDKALQRRVQGKL